LYQSVQTFFTAIVDSRIARIKFYSVVQPQSGAAMPHYRIYSTTAETHISAPPIIVECADDQEAIQKAQQAVNGEAIELWQGERLIVRFPGDEPK
jgi:hypothetical protein